jgi:hypothetical protein
MVPPVGYTHSRIAAFMLIMLMERRSDNGQTEGRILSQVVIVNIDLK